MDRSSITRLAIAETLRLLRTLQGLTQRQVVERAKPFCEDGFGKLLESQISDFENGKAMPTFGTLLNLISACSETGRDVDFQLLQETLEYAVNNSPDALNRRKPVEVDEGISHFERSIRGVRRHFSTIVMENERRLRRDIAQLSSRLAVIEGSSTDRPFYGPNATWSKSMYLLLLRRNQDQSLPISDEAMYEQMAAWTGTIRDSRILHSVVRLEPAGQAVTLRASDDGVVREGRYPVGQDVIGYYLLATQSLDEAVSFAESCPILTVGGLVEIRATAPFADYESLRSLEDQVSRCVV